MEKIRDTNVLESIQLLDMFNQVVSNAENGDVQLVSQTHLRDLFLMAQDGHDGAKDLCDKLGLDEKSLAEWDGKAGDLSLIHI